MNDYRTFLTRWRLPLFFFLLASFMGSANADTAVNKTWSEPMALANTTFDFDGISASISGYYGRGSKIITNNNDKAFAVWKQHDSIASVDTSSSVDQITAKYALWSAYFDGKKWSSPMKIKGNTPRERVTIPELIFDSNGDILAAWAESSGANTILLTSRFNSINRDWESPIQLAYDGQTIGDVKIISRNNGKIHLIWEYGSYTEYLGIVSSVFNGSSWNNPIPLELDWRFRKLRDLVFSNYNNDIMVFFTEGRGEYPNAKEDLFAKYFDGTNWSPRQRLSTAIYIDGVRTAFDNNGNAITVWRDIGLEEDGYPYQVLASHFDRSSRSWSNPVPISVDDMAGYPEIAIDDNGNAIVVWEWGSEILASYFNGSNWSTPLPIPSASGELLKVAFDSNNNAHVAWMGASGHAWINHFDGNRWGSATSMETSKKYVKTDTPLKQYTEISMQPLNIAIGGDGNAHALWDHTVTTWVREGPSTLFPWEETKARTIWTSQLKAEARSPIMIEHALIFTPYGSFVVLVGKGFMDLGGAYPDRSSGVNLVDQNGNVPLHFFDWRDNVILALFAENPETVTLTTPFESKVISLDLW